MRIQKSSRIFADATVDETVCSRDKRACASVGCFGERGVSS